MKPHTNIKTFHLPFILVVLLTLTTVSSIYSADWTLQIVPNRVTQEKQIIDTASPFHVVLTNTSASDLSVWREWCSWGYYCLSFTISIPDGTVFQIKKRPQNWNRNGPDAYLVRPGQHFIWDVRFDDKTWEGFPKVWKNVDVKIEANFSNEKDEESETHKIWTGLISSQPMPVTLYR